MHLKTWPCTRQQTSPHAGSAGSGDTSGQPAKREACLTAAQRAGVLVRVEAMQAILGDTCASAVGLQATEKGCIARQVFSDSWAEDVDVSLPGSGRRLTGRTLASTVPTGALKRVSSEVVITAAVLDVLLMNCNRGLEDVWVDAEMNGRVQLHNHEHVLGTTAMGKRCVSNSIFIPTSQNFRIATLGLPYVSGINPNATSSVHPAQLLDYRCHLPGASKSTASAGKLGTNYPDGIARHLAWLARVPLDDLVTRYGLSDSPEITRWLQKRAKDMLRHGFEWTIIHGDRNVPVGAMNDQHPFEEW
eukprot:jgi/Tetstr1/436054/TSEL_024932.t1